MRHFLTAYEVKVKEKSSMNEFYNLDKIELKINNKEKNHLDLLDCINNYFLPLNKNHYDHEETQKTLKITTQQAKGRQLKGFIEIGEYGEISKIVNKENYKLQYEQKEDDSRLKTYYFLIEIPNDSKIGYLILHKTSNRGIKTPFSKFIIENFKENFDRHTLTISPLIQVELIKNYLDQGRLRKCSFVTHKPPIDIVSKTKASRMLSTFENAATYKLDVIAKKDKGFLKEDLYKVLSKEKNPQDIFVFEGFEYKDFEAEFEVDGRMKKIVMTSPDEFHADIEIKNEELVFENNLPTFESLDEASQNYLKTLRRK